jgi:predicted glycogen debranching enzyme
VLTLQKAECARTAHREWLLTNGRGGYASSTVIGCNTRGYHGLLIGSLDPPAHRIMALSNCLEMVIFGQRVLNLSTFEFDKKFSPAGFCYIRRFYQDVGVHFDYQLEHLNLTKSVYLLRGTDTVAVVYDFTTVREPAEFVLRPFVGLRDFHTLQKSYAPLCVMQRGDGVLVRHDMPGSCELFMKCPALHFEKDKQWWFNFTYRNDIGRGQNHTEDLWTPGFFKGRIDSPGRIVFWANLSIRYRPEQAPTLDIEQACKDLHRYQNSILKKAGRNGSEELTTLYLAADQFIATRTTERNRRTTILAGYPWFADWGRDAFISLGGLLLATGRFEEAKSVLTTFAAAADEGMIPNRFDDRSHTAHFNSVDASLWFIDAAFRYLNAAGDSKTFTQDLLPVIRWIIDSYHKGTRFDIRADADGLITAGNERTQLTWMDAKCDGVAFTPRYGKAVEINALWHNALCLLAEFYARRNPKNAEHYKSMVDRVRASFCELFWNERKGYLNDCILPDGSVDDSLRPNQIFAVSLRFSPLSAERQKAVVEAVQKTLLTPYGLRTLNAEDSRYKGQYTGPQQQRDEAYHQGTVWPYLIGPFVESFLKVNEFSRKSRKAAAELVQPLLRHLTEAGCLGSISEVFDGDHPHAPKGCFAQAWSVAELIRAHRLINS